MKNIKNCCSKKSCFIELPRCNCKNSCSKNQYTISNVGAMGPRGATGPTGPTGPTGVAGGTSRVIARSTTTLSPENNAKVESYENNGSVYLDFFIPRGLPGESLAIKAGNVKSVESNQPAQVTDRYEKDIHYLDFEIPKGAQGQNGQNGEKGEKGETGIAEKIVISQVNTVDYTEPAKIDDVFENNTHNLTFQIPRGEPFKSSKSVAELVKNFSQKISTAGEKIQFDLGTFRNCQTTNTSIEKIKAGMYKVDFGVCLAINNKVKFQLYINDFAIANTSIIIGTNTFAHKSIFVDAPEGASLTLRVSETTDAFDFVKDESYAYVTLTPVLF